MKVPRRTAEPLSSAEPALSPFALVSLVAPFAISKRVAMATEMSSAGDEQALVRDSEPRTLPEAGS